MLFLSFLTKSIVMCYKPRVPSRISFLRLTWCEHTGFTTKAETAHHLVALVCQRGGLPTKKVTCGRELLEAYIVLVSIS